MTAPTPLRLNADQLATLRKRAAATAIGPTTADVMDFADEACDKRSTDWLSAVLGKPWRGWHAATWTETVLVALVYAAEAADDMCRAPDPAYGEYRSVRRTALGWCRDASSAAVAAVADQVAARRGADWCSAVLGLPFPLLPECDTLQARMLMVADDWDITPPLPARVAAVTQLLTGRP